MSNCIHALIGDEKNSAREAVRRELGRLLVGVENVTPPAGVRTGWQALDRHLLWKGFPKSSLSLMVREAGGATSLWTRAAASVTQAGQWVAWVNGPEAELSPWSLRAACVRLDKLLCVSHPSDDRQFLWAMQELMSLCLFEMIGCDLGQIRLREGQLLKLRKLAMRYQTAVVLTQAAEQAPLKSAAYALILHFAGDDVRIERSLHRPPHVLERRDLYAHTLPLLAAGRHALRG